MKEFIDNFRQTIKPEKTKVKSKLSFIWLFGAGGSEILSIDTITSEISPSNVSFTTDDLLKNLSSNRSKFYQWLRHRYPQESDNTFRLPEQFPEWYNIDSGYTNLVDFELDLALISQCIVIFSESIGSHLEIGLFSSFPEIQKSSLIVAPQKHVGNKPNSFYYLGAMKKFQENQLSEDVSNIWVLDEDLSCTELLSEFDEIKSHIYDIITNPENSQENFNPDSRGHTILLIIEILSIFHRLNIKQINQLIEFFEVKIDRKGLKNILKSLEVLRVTTSIIERNVEIYKLDKGYKHTPCLDFSGDTHKKFDRISFKIEMKGKKK